MKYRQVSMQQIYLTFVGLAALILEFLSRFDNLYVFFTLNSLLSALLGRLAAAAKICCLVFLFWNEIAPSDIPTTRYELSRYIKKIKNYNTVNARFFERSNYSGIDPTCSTTPFLNPFRAREISKFIEQRKLIH